MWFRQVIFQKTPRPPGSDSLIPPHTETAVCHLSTNTFSQEHRFKTRVGVRIWVVNTHRQDSAWCRSQNWAFEGKNGIKAGKGEQGCAPSSIGQGTRSCWEPEQMDAP